MGLLISYFVAYLLPFLFTACENVQMASVFYPDEGRYVRVIRGALEAQTLKIHFVSYGHFFFNLVLIPMLFLQQFFAITDVHILLSLRMLSWVFGLGSVWWTYRIGKRFFGKKEAWLSAVLLLVVPLTFTEYSTVAHPDTLQLFFIMASLYYACLLAEEEQVIRNLMWASAMAGLAFSAKYAGILLVPLIAIIFGLQLYQAEELKVSETIKKRVIGLLISLVVLCLFGAMILQESVVLKLFSSDGSIESDWIWDLIGVIRVGLLAVGFVLAALVYLSWSKLFSPKYGELFFGFYYGFMAVVVFSIAFVVSSPNSLLELQFIQGLIYEGHNTRTGGFFTADWQQIGQQWYEMLTSEYLLGTGLFVFGLAASFGYALSKK